MTIFASHDQGWMKHSEMEYRPFCGSSELTPDDTPHQDTEVPTRSL